MRHTRAHSGNRRSHHGLKAASLLLCPKCGNPKLAHRACPNCGFYKGREVLNVSSKAAKKNRKSQVASGK